MLNIEEFIIIYIILNYQINDQVTRVLSCYSIINRIMFEFVIYDQFIIHVMFELTNTIKKPVIDTIHEHRLPFIRTCT